MSDPQVPPGGARKRLGGQGEQKVVDALLARGFRVLARNLRSRFGELDVVAARENVLWFVEVKTRRGARGLPVEVSAQQRHRITRMAYSFLQSHGPSYESIQFVVAVVRVRDGAYEIEWLEQAFEGTF